MLLLLLLFFHEKKSRGKWFHSSKLTSWNPGHFHLPSLPFLVGSFLLPGYFMILFYCIARSKEQARGKREPLPAEVSLLQNNCSDYHNHCTGKIYWWMLKLVSESLKKKNYSESLTQQPSHFRYQNVVIWLHVASKSLKKVVFLSDEIC